jgi:hypothetical protein
MKKLLYDVYIYILKKLGLYSLYSLKRSGPLKEDGWFRSFREAASVDAEGNPLPWLTYPSIEFLKKRIKKEMSVFEYGCGNSTLWWAARVKEIVSVEHDEKWYKKNASKAPDNVFLNHIELEYGGAYSNKIKEFRNKFDIVVIDGRDRVNCTINCIDALKPDGVVIWDNSDRPEYEEGYSFLYNNGFKKLEFIGMCPVINFKTETSIFYRENNVFNV